ncbi:ead/Ea22-like family protein [Salmonella enterica]|uniref:Ead/Ea22-like family protein n=2 Tax=Salmonella enterica I TaxID=59201 RepID=A0A5Z7FA45_SALET|nr:ead/Ea22-like family protein [Salmonella enterica]EAW1255507.1 ead/Ea22-like family protein [Salmonella enterica subsp. enterica]EBF6602867.1 ead/Ea22-like family protein [Salmonella enterica subsp. enterica serovar Newport]EBS3058760.1 ead/Ea22-like family protein [Salmonella enterica subsp. enterica serovar Litchfield]EBU8635675.1 ead/Ea22-like family protein [Salmonella enterica subsp. enterica serovar Saintpaul]EBU9307637.1 ead/Ea22-like family protein [Salmonella enterica subsp. enteri
MSNIDKQALREAAVAIETVATPQKLLAFRVKVTPQVVLALLDENLQLQREKDAIEAVALALRDDMRQAREQLEAGWKQNATDVQIKARLCRESNSLHDRLREAEKRIAELEAREVSVSEIRKNKFIEKTEDELDGDHYTICKNG